MSCYHFVTKLLQRRKINNMPANGEDDDEEVLALRQLVDEQCHALDVKDDLIKQLKSELNDKECLIKHLQNEIDKFRQVVKPITQKIITKRLTFGDEFWPGPGLENTRVQTIIEPRIKRQAISAEPLNSQGNDLHITKIAKSQQ